MINEFKSYHGSVFAELIDESTIPIKLFRPDLGNNSYYILNDHVALYVKHSTKRLTPWRFTFHTNHVEDMKTLFSKHEHVFLVLVCGRDCIAVVERSEIERVLPVDSPSLAWVSVQTSQKIEPVVFYVQL